MAASKRENLGTADGEQNVFLRFKVTAKRRFCCVMFLLRPTA